MALTLKQIEEHYGRCSVRKLDRKRAEGIGCRYVRIDGRILYRRADVDRFIEANLRLAGTIRSLSEEGALRSAAVRQMAARRGRI
jgi:hypothetical protein